MPDKKFSRERRLYLARRNDDARAFRSAKGTREGHGISSDKFHCD